MTASSYKKNCPEGFISLESPCFISIGWCIPDLQFVNRLGQENGYEPFQAISSTFRWILRENSFNKEANKEVLFKAALNSSHYIIFS